ncbi:MAG: CHRD domain-containing protein [Thermoanaerobaculaceae bacterium]|nr:CHRD domain-containing protein [Thermoanaerobaculaceae bacterium]
MKRLISVLFVATLALFAASGGAQTFTMTLAGSRETGGGDPAGRGLAVITINGGNVYYFLWVENIASPAAAHIHSGIQGVSGGVLIGLDPAWSNVATNTYTAAGSVPVDAATTQPILQNPAAYYVNVHNGPFPNGAMRGQLLGDGPSSFALATTLLGSREPGGGSTSGQGFAALVFDSTTLYYYLWEAGLSAPTAAHVHSGGAGVNGSVLIGLSPSFSGGQATGKVPVDAATLAAIQANPDLYYVNIHTGDFPNGAIRGQLAATETDVNFAVAAHNAGLGTSFFRTDMRALSLTDESATVYAQWYLHGVNNATGPTSTTQFTIAANGEAVYDDVVSSLFATSDRGAIRLLSAFPFKAIARNFNDQRPSGGGTFGQDEPGLGLDGALTSGVLMLNSNRPKADAQGFRTNVGYFNPSPYPVDVTFNVHRPDGTLVAPPSKATFPAWDDDQALFYQFIPGIPADQQTLQDFFITFTATKPIYIFSSPVDNKTDDGLHQPALAVPAAMTQPVASAQAASPTGTITAPPSDASVSAGSAVSFQGTGTDPHGESLTVTWDFGDGNSGTGYATSHTYASAGTFTVTMMVKNTDGVSDPNPPTRTITVTPAQQSSTPSGTITTPAGNTTAFTNYSVSFMGSGTDPHGETLTAAWNFGDGATATGFTASHTYASAGVYTVTFTVKNTDGVSDPNPPTRTITVSNYTYGY